MTQVLITSILAYFICDVGLFRVALDMYAHMYALDMYAHMYGPI